MSRADPRRILMHRKQAGDTAADLIFAPDEIAGTLGRDQDHVEVCPRLHLAVKHRKAVRDEQRASRRKVGLDISGVDLAMSHVGS